MKKHRTNLILDAKLYKDFKVLAQSRDMSVSQLLRKLIREELENENR